MEVAQEIKPDKEESVKLVYEQYAQKLLTYATRTWNLEKDTAWDLIYKTIYKVVEVKDNYQFETEQKFASFIFKIFINKIRDHFRNTKTQPKAIDNAELNDRIINNQPATSGTRKESNNPALKLLQAELDKLEDWQRVLMLLRSQDMPYSEIAKYTNKPEKHLKVYYARIKEQLTHSINQQLNTK